jgi:hypothetical protein
MEYVPAAQAPHVDDPAVAAYLPAARSVQAVPPSEEFDPAGQLEHVLLANEEYLPAVHVEHMEAVEAEYFPAGQDAQVVFANIA